MTAGISPCEGAKNHTPEAALCRSCLRSDHRIKTTLALIAPEVREAGGRYWCPNYLSAGIDIDAVHKRFADSEGGEHD